jgi:hypothetical protein
MNDMQVLFRQIVGLFEAAFLLLGLGMIYWGFTQTDTILQEQASFILAGALFVLALLCQMMINGSLQGEHIGYIISRERQRAKQAATAARKRQDQESAQQETEP